MPQRVNENDSANTVREAINANFSDHEGRIGGVEANLPVRGLPEGGETGQVPRKRSPADHDWEFYEPSEPTNPGGPGGTGGGGFASYVEPVMTGNPNSTMVLTDEGDCVMVTNGPA